ncbi:MAG: RNA-binding transcriptional accessory protein [Bacteroidetes bacterium]|nr:MAG: RNA-binding transcriptional accessory protein [Bacteroidota bacterium]
MTKKQMQIITKELSLTEKQVENTIGLLKKGATIPFISRYRKELTGNLDEVQIKSISTRLIKLEEIEKRKEAILKSIKEQNKLTDELKNKIENIFDLNELEDIYLPFKQKRKTRASIAKEKGLEPLARIIMKQNILNLQSKAQEFINKEVKTKEEALSGARDIIAEWISENQTARKKIRFLFNKNAIITSKVIKKKEEEASKYSDYFDTQEYLNRCASHRLLAIRRGETEGYLRVSISIDEQDAIDCLENLFIKSDFEAAEQISIAIKDSYKRLISPSIENEFNNLSKEKADDEAIAVFAENLRQLLLASPLGQKRVLAIDPGFRTGCKIVCLDQQGTLLHNETIYPNKPQQEYKVASKKIASMVNAYKIEAIAIGNGTASRETEYFVKNLKLDRKVNVFVVSENGASIYSASAVAREEFPQYDVTVRGAVSIGRRLMDPLAELVKIDPKSIGVGQYQHDVEQHKLKNALDSVVESCVNLVGVNLNTASKHLLSYVSGLGPQLAQNIIDYRKENNTFKSRNELLNVPRLGNKAYEQCAGFLRITDAENPLDNSAVHPESYFIVKKMADDLNCYVKDLLLSEELRKKINISRYVTDKIGIPTLSDIINELAKPGRDPREKIKLFEFSNDVYKISDLKIGMILPGIVTNITNFGAFIDIGVHQDGLVHISQLKNEFVKNPADVVKLHQHVKVKVIDVDVERKRIQLSMKDL